MGHVTFNLWYQCPWGSLFKQKVYRIVGSPQGENSMAVSGLSYRNVLVGITWVGHFSPAIHKINGLRKQSSHLVRCPCPAVKLRVNELKVIGREAWLYNDSSLLNMGVVGAWTTFCLFRDYNCFLQFRKQLLILLYPNKQHSVVLCLPSLSSTQHREQLPWTIQIMENNLHHVVVTRVLGAEHRNY